MKKRICDIKLAVLHIEDEGPADGKQTYNCASKTLYLPACELIKR